MTVLITPLEVEGEMTVGIDGRLFQLKAEGDRLQMICPGWWAAFRAWSALPRDRRRTYLRRVHWALLVGDLRLDVVVGRWRLLTLGVGASSSWVARRLKLTGI